jgi:hypothetical protein
MKAGTVVLGMMLAVSGLVNLVLLARLRERGEVKAGAPAASPRASLRDDRAPQPARAERPLEAAVPLPSPVAEPAAAAPLTVKSGGAKAAPAPITIPAVRNDPQVLGVLEAQEEFNVFWKDLDRVFKARSKFDEPKYFQTVVTATEDFLGLPESTRAAFREAAKSGASGLAYARREYDAARKALPPKDKANVAAYAAYQQQKEALDIRYQEQTRLAVEGVKVHLDPKQPRHAELASNLEKWLKNLAPKATQP